MRHAGRQAQCSCVAERKREKDSCKLDDWLQGKGGRRKRESYQFDDLLSDDIFDDTSGFDGRLGGFARDVHHLLEVKSR